MDRDLPDPFALAVDPQDPFAGRRAHVIDIEGRNLGDPGSGIEIPSNFPARLRMLAEERGESLSQLVTSALPAELGPGERKVEPSSMRRGGVRASDESDQQALNIDGPRHHRSRFQLIG